MEAQVPDTQKNGPKPPSAAASSARDTALLLGSIALVVGGLWAFYHFDPQLNVLVRTLILLASLAASLAAAYQTALGREMWGYISGSRTEWRKIVWPTRQESLQATLMIVVIVLIFSLFLAGVDWLLNMGVQALTGRGD